jgi:hypothetical protein
VRAPPSGRERAERRRLAACAAAVCTGISVTTTRGACGCIGADSTGAVAVVAELGPAMADLIVDAISLVIVYFCASTAP